MKKTIRDLEVENKRVLVRLDYNVPIDKETKKIMDDNRIMESLATVNYLCDHKAKVIICSHLGRPDGRFSEEYSLKPVAEYLGKLIKHKVEFASDIIGADAHKKIKNMQAGDVVVLENVRFDKREEENDEEFSRELADLADYYVNDAFGTAHRKHASTYGVAEILPNAVGSLINKELKVINGILSEPKRPFVAVLGGAKIQDKIPVIENLLDKADTLLIGGGMAYTFVKAQGGKVGKSLVDATKLDLCKKYLEKAKKNNVEIVLPVDNLCNLDFESKVKPVKFPSNEIGDEYMGLDIGPKTVKLFSKYIKTAGTIVWNGPMGVFEKPEYAHGTNRIAKAVAKSRAFSFVGGGDSAAAVVRAGYSKRIDHLSTGGGASLILFEGGSLPGIDIIDEVGTKHVNKKATSKKVATKKTTTAKKTTRKVTK